MFLYMAAQRWVGHDGELVLQPIRFMVPLKV